MTDNKESMTGKVYGCLTLIKEPVRRDGSSFVWCRCECGKEKELNYYNVKYGKTKSCGCLKAKAIKERCKTQLSQVKGERFGRLRIIDNGSKSRTSFICQCDCGKRKDVALSSLRGGRTQSCGCLLDEHNEKRKREKVSGTRLYGLWTAQKERCSNANCKSYKRYGGRGITMHEDWVNDFESYKSWIVSNLGEGIEGFSMDRVDNDKGYEPGNLRWASHTQQARNTSRNVNLTHEGETKTMREWSECLGIGYSTLAARVNHLGWDVVKALETPVRSHVVLSV